MSSLVVGRQRRGKLELSTINDISKMVSAEQVYPLGYEITVPGTQIPDGNFPSWASDQALGPAREVISADLGQVPQTWVYVRNGSQAAATTLGGFVVGGWCVHLYYASGVPIAVNDPRKSAAPFVVGFIPPVPLPGAPTGTNIVGLAQFDIPEGHYGFILRKGVGKALFNNDNAPLRAGMIVVADALNSDGRCEGLVPAAVPPDQGGFGIVVDDFTPTIGPPPTGPYLNTVYINCLG